MEGDIDKKRGLMLEGLTLYLKEDFSELVKECSEVSDFSELCIIVYSSPLLKI